VLAVQGLPIVSGPVGDAYFWFGICACAGDNETTAASAATKQINRKFVMEHSSRKIVMVIGPPCRLI
jgi:hypothetical protein